MVVDDDDDTRDIVAAQLNECHADVVTASSAAKAFEVLRVQHVDVLLADISMP